MTRSTDGGGPSGAATEGTLRVRRVSGAAGPLVPLEIAASPRARARGLLGRDGIDGALLLSPAHGVHTLGMRFAIDVAFLDAHLRVLAVRTMRPGRLGLPRPAARHVLEAEAGAMAVWGLERGASVEIAGGLNL
ncbi:DUF192 domain-containing protein [Streptomyces sp. NPDC007088]|uniref:DUF192 domain-containing protein n=1 Tax=Streptomyces sp. NPDC007088 TaxID=3364773 RepID=UPI003676E98E